MKDKYEFEYNFIVIDSSILNQIRQKFELTSKTVLTDFYLDTKDRILQKNKYVFRRRRDSNDEIMYTIKGPTRTIGGIPKRLELEDKNYNHMLTELESRLDIKEPREIEVIQQRITEREEYNYGGFAIFIDKTTFEDNAYYYSIEIELYNEDNKRLFTAIKDDVDTRAGIHEWKYSKFQMGEAIKELHITGELDSNDFTKIARYLENKNNRC